MGVVARAGQRFWSLSSRAWDDGLTDTTVANRVDELAGRLRAELPASPVVVDLGCGTGNHATAIRAGAPSVTVIGIDSAPGMLAKARTKVDAAGAPLALVRADLRLSLPDRSTTVVARRRST